MQQNPGSVLVDLLPLMIGAAVAPVSIIIALFFTIRVLAVRYDWRTQAVLPHTEGQ